MARALAAVRVRGQCTSKVCQGPKIMASASATSPPPVSLAGSVSARRLERQRQKATRSTPPGLGSLTEDDGAAAAGPSSAVAVWVPPSTHTGAFLSYANGAWPAHMKPFMSYDITVNKKVKPPTTPPTASPPLAATLALSPPPLPTVNATAPTPGQGHELAPATAVA